jgi:galactokinase
MITREQFFGGAPAVRASAPGRVNLLGEHTDYNDGYMLPTATPQRTEVSLGPSPDGQHHLYAADLEQTAVLAGAGDIAGGAAANTPQFARYIEGCIRLVQQRGVRVPPLRIHVHSTVAMGSGLSSSAALEIATLRALRDLLKLDFDDVVLAQIGQQAEIEYARVNCGIMDQMASSIADEEHMLFIDARTLESRLLPLPEGAGLVVVDTGVARKLADSKYNERRRECEEAARQLGVRALRDCTDLDAVERLPGVYRLRARHVVGENLRVLQACEGVSAEKFGELMNASHFSLRDDYEVSIPALDHLSALLREHVDVYGARLTGAGFGGACVALVMRGREQTVADSVLHAYDAAGYRGKILLPEPAPQTAG